MNDREARWADLFRRALRGDGPAYAAFLTEAAPVLRRIVRARCGDGATEVEDVVQEILLAVHAKRHTWRAADPVSPWLYAIARYKSADALRRRGLPVVPIAEMEDLLPDAAAAGDALAARDLERLIGTIDARSAVIVRAIGIEGRSAGEVGSDLGLSEGAVRVAYHRAMQRLRQAAAGPGGREP